MACPQAAPPAPSAPCSAQTPADCRRKENNVRAQGQVKKSGHWGELNGGQVTGVKTSSHRVRSMGVRSLGSIHRARSLGSATRPVHIISHLVRSMGSGHPQRIRRSAVNHKTKRKNYRDIFFHLSPRTVIIFVEQLLYSSRRPMKYVLAVHIKLRPHLNSLCSIEMHTHTHKTSEITKTEVAFFAVFTDVKIPGIPDYPGNSAVVHLFNSPGKAATNALPGTPRHRPRELTQRPHPTTLPSPAQTAPLHLTGTSPGGGPAQGGGGSVLT